MTWLFRARKARRASKARHLHNPGAECGKELQCAAECRGCHPAHHSQRCLRPRALGDVCLHDARFGGPHPCGPPTASIITRLLSAAAKNSAMDSSRRPHEHVHSSLRCNQGARLDGECARAVVPHGRTHCPHSTWRDGQRRPTARRRGGPQLSSRSGREPEFGLRPQHSP